MVYKEAVYFERHDEKFTRQIVLDIQNSLISEFEGDVSIIKARKRYEKYTKEMCD